MVNSCDRCKWHMRTSASRTCSSTQQISSVNCLQWWLLPTVNLLASKLRSRNRNLLSLLGSKLPSFKFATVSQHRDGNNEGRGFIRRSLLTCSYDPTDTCSIVCGAKEDILAIKRLPGIWHLHCIQPGTVCMFGVPARFMQHEQDLYGMYGASH